MKVFSLTKTKLNYKIWKYRVILKTKSTDINKLNKSLIKNKICLTKCPMQ